MLTGLYLCKCLCMTYKHVKQEGTVGQRIEKLIWRSERKKINNLFGSLGSACIAKNCDQGLENAIQGHKPRAALIFQDRGHSFLVLRPLRWEKNNTFCSFLQISQIIYLSLIYRMFCSIYLKNALIFGKPILVEIDFKKISPWSLYFFFTRAWNHGD